MIAPLTEQEWQTNEAIARRLNVVIEAVNRLLAGDLVIELPTHDRNVVQQVRGRLVLGEEDK